MLFLTETNKFKVVFQFYNRTGFALQKFNELSLHPAYYNGK